MPCDDVDMLSDVQHLASILEEVLNALGQRDKLWLIPNVLAVEAKQLLDYVREHYPS